MVIEQIATESRRHLAFHKEHIMFTNVFGKEEITAKAAAHGLKAGESITRSYGTPALGGNTFAIKDVLKAAGARWMAADKVWGFASWAALDAALDALA